MRRFTLLQNSALALATLITGVMAGFFYTYTFNVNLALLEVDGPTYATVQSLLNENVRHVAFFVFFFGGGVVPVIAVAVNVAHYKHVSFWLIVGAAMLYIFGIIAFTASVNLPLNAYTESWDPNALPSDWAQTRTDWNQANNLRVGASGLAFLLYVAAFVIRATTGRDPITPTGRDAG